MDVSRTVFEMLTHKAAKWPVFVHPSLVRRSRSGDPLEFLDET